MFEVKFGIEPKNKVTFNSAIGAVVIVGLGFGSVCGGLLMKIGRRHSLMIANITGLVGVALTAGTFYRSIPLLMVGRMVFGFAGGLISSIGPRLIEESVPAHLYGQLAITFNLGMNTGTIFSFAWAEVLPNDEDIVALKTTNLWMFPYLVFPSLLFIITLLGQTYIVTEDSIKFLIVNKKEREARAHVRKMYKHATNDQKADAIIEAIRDKISTSSSDLTLRDAIFDPRYRTATWINLIYMIFHELTGINVITMYSNTMFRRMHSEGASFTPRQGTYLVGATSFIGSLISIKVIEYVGRRPLLVCGHFLIAAIHCAVGRFNDTGNNAGVLSMILLFLIVYQNTTGPMTWVYCTETTIDSALGLCLFVLYGTIFLQTVMCPELMEPESIGPSGMFYIFGFLSLVGCLFCWVYIKETSGLTDKEKKMLFVPSKFKHEFI